MYSTKLQILCTRWCAKEHRYTFGVRIRTLRMGTFYHLLLHFRPNSFFNVIDGVVHDHIKNSFVRKMHRWTFCKKKQKKKHQHEAQKQSFHLHNRGVCAVYEREKFSHFCQFFWTVLSAPFSLPFLFSYPFYLFLSNQTKANIGFRFFFYSLHVSHKQVLWPFYVF